MTKIKISSGIVILYKKTMLVCHPTNASWKNSFTPPKGGLEDGETLIEGAIRETKEEVGVTIEKSIIKNIDNPIEFSYTNKKGKVYKKVYFYVVKIKDLSEINLTDVILNESNLQLSEVDWAGFLNKTELKSKIFNRFKKLIDLL
jgi:ADP-ribose pyrophosphatase YjhB (NUDIX family)